MIGNHRMEVKLPAFSAAICEAMLVCAELIHDLMLVFGFSTF